MVSVQVPDGVYENDEFVLEYNGTQLTVTCPAGCGPGSEITLEIPGDGAGPSNTAQMVEITVPEGCWPGMDFTVDFEGRTFTIAVPDGVEPGMALQVDVPQAEAENPAEAEDYGDQSHYKFQPGQRVELYRSDGAESPGYIVCGFEGVFDVCYKVKLDNGLFKEAVAEEDISAAVTGDVGDLFDGWG